MRRAKRLFCLTLSVTFIAAFVLAASTQAGLLSEFNFEEGNGATTYNSVAGVNPGTLYGPDWVAGKIGDYALDFNGATGGDYVDPTAGSYPNNTAGLATGTFSFWIKTTTTDKKRHVYGSNSSEYTNFAPALLNSDASGNEEAGNIYFYLRADYGSSYHRIAADLTTADTSWENGDWHLIAVAWDTKLSGAAANTVQFYIDGEARATSLRYTQITSSDVFNAWDMSRIGGSMSPTSSAYTDGSLDDISSWGDMLTDAEAMALYKLGDDSVLNYSASDAQMLFDIFESQGSGTTSDGSTWTYKTGLSGDLGYVYDHNTLILGSGVGVQIIPEPATFVLLVSGLIGLLAYAWRKRK